MNIDKFADSRDMESDKQEKTVIETLYIENFISISELKWEIKEFNILTGHMAAGKSIIMKLLWFLQDILYRLIFIPASTFTRKDLDETTFLEKISTTFYSIFAKSIDFTKTKIEYEFEYDGIRFDLQAIWDKKNKILKWSSEYLRTHLKEWQGFFGNDEPYVNISKAVADRIFQSISSEFSGTFPLGTLFVPASRAIAALSNASQFNDIFITRFISNCSFFRDNLKSLEIQETLRLLMFEDLDLEGELVATLKKKIGTVTPVHFSSGQQELLYLMLMMNYTELYARSITSPVVYSERASLFIEEPEAHLFPLEQKEILEYIVRIYRKCKETRGNNTNRFFMTTHSPYILNVASTMMNRGRLKDSGGDLGLHKDHYFGTGEVSAYFINRDGSVSNMVSDNESYMFSDIIQDISQIITDEASAVNKSIRQIRKRSETHDTEKAGNAK
jgi:AAA15 family ATPase/GTPase